MVPPFSSEEFFQVFSLYNTAVWPAQILLVLLALAASILAFRDEEWAGKAVMAVLGSFWVWMGIAYHWAFFVDVNPTAWAFGAFFVVEGALLFWFGLRRGEIRFRPRPDLFGLAGGFFIAYGLVIYPILGLFLGHRYPAQPTFGLPCPTTIFTIGMLLWAESRVPWAVLVIPALWSVVGMSAVRYFGVLEDSMLPVAGILGTALILWKNRRPSGFATRKASTTLD